MHDDWKHAVLHLQQARSDAQKGIENLGKASESLKLFVKANEGARTNPARQENLEGIEKRLVKARYEICEIDRLIEELENAWRE